MLIESMERDLGLNTLSRHERDVLYVLQELCGEENRFVRSDAIRRHDLLKPMTQPTFYRALRQLLERNLIEMPEGSKAGSYRIVPGAEFNL